MNGKKLEKHIQNEIINFLRTLDIFCWVNKTQGTYDPVKRVFRRNPAMMKGVSDVLGIVGGRFLAIEVKTDVGRVSPEQRVFLARVSTEGGIAFVARSVQDVAVNLSKFFPDNIGLKKMATGEVHLPQSRLDQ